MVARNALMLAFMGLLISACSGGADKAPVADLILHNGSIYTANAGQQSVQALAVSGDRIMAVGNSAEVLAYAGEKTQVIDLQGAAVLPGLHDTHIHPFGILKYDACNLDSQGMNLEQLAGFVSDCIERLEVEEGQWLTVLQWAFADNNKPAGGLDTIRAALDRASQTNPIILLGNDGHHFATNTRGLERAALQDGTRVGLSAETLRKHFGDYVAYVGLDGDGDPNGAVNEVMPNVLGAPTLLNPNVQQLIPYVDQIPRRLHSLGITSIQDAAFAHSMEPLYDALLAQGPLQLRIRLAQFLPPPMFTREDGSLDIPAMLVLAQEMRDKYASVPNVDANALKFFIDGVLEGNPLADPPTLPNAAQLAPFHHPRFSFDLEAGSAALTGYAESETAYNGVLASPPRETALAFVAAADEAGFAVHLHAIGDRAVRVGVDAIEQVTPAGTTVNRHSMTHLQMVADAEIERLGHLKIPLAFTYSWAARAFEYDMSVVPFIDKLDSLEDMYKPGNYHYRNSYPVASIKRAGGILAAGSDAPVDTDDPRPFFHIQTAVTRDRGEGPLNVGQVLSIFDAIDAYTINGARLLGLQEVTGSLEAGKKADFIVLDRSVIALVEAGKASAVGGTRVEQTWFDGQLVYRAESPALPKAADVQ